MGVQFVTLFRNPGGPCQCPYGGGGGSFTARLVERLIAYNRCDVMNLIPLLAEVHARLARERAENHGAGAAACG
ncbi:MAG: hypothetical protein ACRD2E_07025 [Terriglobales bacterium]